MNKHQMLARAGAAALLALSLLPRLNKWLSRRKVNNYLTDKSWDWKREVVVVTGGSSGIGATIVAKLAQRNVKVIILDLNGPQGALFDLSDPSAIASVADRVRKEHGDPTVLVNNAGIGNAMPLLDLPEPKIRKLFEVNVIALILLVKEFLPSMVQRNHGHIVNIASMASFSTQASNVDYACSKAAVLSFSEGLAQELRHIYKAPMVRTSVVHPTWVQTPMIAKLKEQGRMRDPTVTPEEVAGRIVDQLYSTYGAQIVVPESLGWVSFLRGFPGWLQESVRDTRTKSLANVHQMWRDRTCQKNIRKSHNNSNS
ncbi:uncharacterized protein NECHADRAFT_95906 [Fusarium vanettenii 77-13-4]|uniref:Short-chain dehydrogenase/reductase 3 n=1 Tax=Fusarium vanettenii (strain ATCC MYA-4622 / CBS 123669 / FGSC 9596 / NRRL 45880 / 77-13-4) TaxID=660122 RepID=C7ZCR1_FUSV7|nr:uncharacterized protein NECHADRAFT_95906 [Fusarium vanettenii 77-13-4]EEU37965.1 hypothetical protein NECHADRAFT_95906 [Fusarium vanettenii 77-13-4]